MTEKLGPALRIHGGIKLNGVISVSGSKNAALPLLAASLLTDEEIILENVPDISDVGVMLELLHGLGAEIQQYEDHSISIRFENEPGFAPDPELCKKMRASICLLGPLAARRKRARMYMPGGCVIGQRPVDIHLKALEKLGAQVSTNRGFFEVDANELVGRTIYMGGSSGSTVTGTENVIMAAVKAKGETKIVYAATEPEVVQLCEVLNAMGARISGVGSQTLTIEGVETLHGGMFRVIPDRIEAGTLILAAVATRGNVRVDNCEPAHLAALLDVLDSARVQMRIGENFVEIQDSWLLSGTEVTSLPYPGFPTDLQPIICSVLATAERMSVIADTIYPDRMGHVGELARLGAIMKSKYGTIFITGIPQLSGADVDAQDIRMGAALIVAALSASGSSKITGIKYILRGYENLDERLRNIGAEIEVVHEDVPVV